MVALTAFHNTRYFNDSKHMTGEEAVFFPAALDALTEDDWVEIDRKVDGFDDPLGRNSLQERFSALGEQLKSRRSATA